jgi:outer membrane protein assembly factor BamB
MKAIICTIIILLVFYLPLKDCQYILNTDLLEDYILLTKSEEPIRFPQVINSTFLGNERRNYYGENPPDTLEKIWVKDIQYGKTRLGNKTVVWNGAGWTGQPLMVMDADSQLCLLQGTYNHHLYRLDAATGKTKWRYRFNDVIKGTASIYSKHVSDSSNQLSILQGSRMGLYKNIYVKEVPSYRSISYETGKEQWRYNSRKTDSYSRDVDGSALILGDTAYLGLENGHFMVFDPDSAISDSIGKYAHPKVHAYHALYDTNDVKKHRGNLVTESSPAKLGDHIYITSGSGHVYGYNLNTKRIDWDFYIGSDMDGSPVVTDDSCLLVSVERQYIKGKGGLFKLDPSKHPDSCVLWYFPTGNLNLAGWHGGIIGTAATNDHYRKEGDPHYVALSAIDGHLYVLDEFEMQNDSVWGPNKKFKYPTPKQVFKYHTGPSISTPLLFRDRIFAGGYFGLYMFIMNEEGEFEYKQIYHTGSIEATPFVYNKCLYVASRSGYLYCLGNK